MTVDLPQTILITGARAPVAVHLARLLAGAGHRVVMADSFEVPLARASRACHAFVTLPSPRQAFDACRVALQTAIEDHDIGLILPTCEEVFHLSRMAPDLSVPVLAPPIDMLARVHAKDAFIALVAEMGLPVPRTETVTSPDALLALAGRAGENVFKPVWSRFATQTLIRPHPRALARVSPSPSAPWVMQEFVAGEEVSAYAVARHGRLTALASYRSLYRAGTGAAIAFSPDPAPDVRDWVARFVAWTGWDGQVSFDLVRTPDGTLLPLECNPRAISGVHFFRNPGAFSIALAGGAEATPDLSVDLGVRMAMWVFGLPQALVRARLGRFLSDVARVRDVLAWPEDPGPARAQIATLAHFARIALRERISLQAASTWDIEWNGPDQSSIS